MKNIILKLIFSLTAIVTFAACSDSPEEPVTESPRAVLVYMVANNSLGSGHFDDSDLKEMIAAARNGDLGSSRLLVYHHPRNDTPVLKEITSDGEQVLITYDTSSSSVSSARMSRVIDDFKHLAPATRYGLILWSHGTGWIENGIESDNAPARDMVQTQSFGDDGGRYMNVTTLGRTLAGKGFDYIYFDCCYMAGVEVAYELRRCADFIVGSSTELPANGMPYDRTLLHLMKADADLTGAAGETFDHYDSLTGQSRTCTISVIATEGLDNLAAATRAVYTANNVTSTGFRPQQFMTSACYLFDLRQYVDDLSRDYPELKADFDAAMSRVVVYKASTPRLWNAVELTHHSGLSTFLPDFATTNTYNYDNLQWAGDVASALHSRQ